MSRLYLDEYRRRCTTCPSCGGALQVWPRGSGVSLRCLSARCEDDDVRAKLGEPAIVEIAAELAMPRTQTSDEPPPVATPPVGLVARRASEIDVEQVRYLVPERVPLGALTLLVGDPGLGKSTVTAAWAAGTSTGRYGDPAAVLIANAEDSAAHVTVPRLAAAGADLERVEFFSYGDEHGERPIVLPDDVPAIEAHAVSVGARLVVIDPLAAHLADDVSAHRDHSVRRALAPLAAMAERTGAAVACVLHLNKAAGSDVTYRIGGSIGIVGAARSVLLLGRDPDDPEGEDGDRRALAHIKSNWGKLAPTLLYAHEPATVTVRGRTVETHRLADLGESEVDGRALLGANHDDSPASQRERAAELLADHLGDGDWHRARDIITIAKRDAIGARTLDRACTDVGVERDRRGFPAVAFWRLPATVASLAIPRGDTDSPPAWRDSGSPATTGDSGVSLAQSRQPHGSGDTGTVVPLPRPLSAIGGDCRDDGPAGGAA